MSKRHRDDKSQSFGSKTDSEGYPVVPRAGVAFFNGRARMKSPNAGLNLIVSMLCQYLRSPVNDDTGLAAKYDVDLFWNDRTTDAGERAGRIWSPLSRSNSD